MSKSFKVTKEWPEERHVDLFSPERVEVQDEQIAAVICICRQRQCNVCNSR